MKKKFQTEREMLKDSLLKKGDYVSIREMMARLSELIPDRRLLAEMDSDKNIVHYTAKDILEEVMNLGGGLIDSGLKDAHIAIVSENCCRYVLADMCVSGGVGVVVPIDFNAPQELLETLLNKCDADAAFCSESVLENLQAARKNCPRLKTVITIDRKVRDIPYYEEYVSRGASPDCTDEYRRMDLDLDAPAKILFTSGTTGANKGVVLTNRNLAANIMNCMNTIEAVDGDENTDVSILPMHHATEINTHVLTRMGSGRLTYVNGNIRNLMANMKVFKPLMITVVPMIANAFYKNIWLGAKKAGKEEKLRKGIKISNVLRKFGIDRTHELFADLFEPFGGNLRAIVCGGSMLNPVVIKGMNDLGVRIENGYGITECGPLVSMNSDTLREHLSVGKPCPGLQVRISDPDENGIGELCVKGPSVARGYYKDEAATAAVFGADGFFNTGDAAKLDSRGRIILMGRKKNTIVLENGKNVCPEEIENIIETNIDYADEIVVYQADLDGTALMCAGLFIKDEELRSRRGTIAADIARVNSKLPSYKRIEYVELPAAEYEKTSTRKIKRAFLPKVCSGEGIKIN